MKKFIITFLTLTLISTVFAACANTTEETTTEPTTEIVTEEITVDEETTAEEPATEEATTEEPTTEEKTTKAPETTTKKKEENTTKKQETTTKKQESTTKKQETTTKKEETTTKKTETTTKNTQETITLKQNTTNNKEETTTVDLSVMVIGCSPERAGLFYTLEGYLTTYENIPEGAIYFQYDKDGYAQTKNKPYSPGNEPTINPDLCPRCGKEMKPYDGKHYGCYYGYCGSWINDINCPECGVFVKAHTCHTCKK